MALVVYDNSWRFKVFVVMHIKPVWLGLFVVEYVQTFHGLTIRYSESTWG